MTQVYLLVDTSEKNDVVGVYSSSDLAHRAKELNKKEDNYIDNCA